MGSGYTAVFLGIFRISVLQVQILVDNRVGSDYSLKEKEESDMSRVSVGVGDYVTIKFYKPVFRLVDRDGVSLAGVQLKGVAHEHFTGKIVDARDLGEKFVVNGVEKPDYRFTLQDQYGVKIEVSRSNCESCVQYVP